MSESAAAAIEPALLEAARRTLRKHGYKNMTAERVALEAGISRVTLHRRGIRREDLLAALADIAVTAYRDALWPALVSDATGLQRLRMALSALFGVAEEYLEVLIAVQASSDAIFHEEGGSEETAIETRLPFVEPFERVLRDGAADHTLRPVADPHETATVLFNAAGWTYIHLRHGHRFSAERARDSLVDLLLGGLIPTKPVPERAERRRRPQ